MAQRKQPTKTINKHYAGADIDEIAKKMRG